MREVLAAQAFRSAWMGCWRFGKRLGAFLLFKLRAGILCEEPYGCGACCTAL